MGQFNTNGWIKLRDTLAGPAQFDPMTEPTEPCEFLPGSPQKVQLLQDRMSAGTRLWHKDDLNYERMSDEYTRGVQLDRDEEEFMSAFFETDGAMQ